MISLMGTHSGFTEFKWEFKFMMEKVNTPTRVRRVQGCIILISNEEGEKKATCALEAEKKMRSRRMQLMKR